MEKSKLVESFEKHIALFKSGTSFSAIPGIVRLLKNATTDEKEQIKKILKNEKRVLRLLCIINSPVTLSLCSLLDQQGESDCEVFDFLFMEIKEPPITIINGISGDTAEQQQKLTDAIIFAKRNKGGYTLTDLAMIKKVGITNIDTLIQLAESVEEASSPEAQNRILELIKLHSQTDLKEYVLRKLGKYQGEKKNEIFEFVKRVKNI
ncbi:MAG: hypothetical protein LiPW41_293 [Parcubacteria group bacterium LiPW_41]|nr:MAG: hypothetical protein LiPW41_293 [Parcubacteria group bacterium LiPW_41]